MSRPLELDSIDWKKVARSFVLGLSGILSALGYVWITDEANQGMLVAFIAALSPVVVQFARKLLSNSEGDAS